MIEIYSQAKHAEDIRKLLDSDKEGKALIGEIGLFEPPKDCDYWDYRIVIYNGNVLAGFAFFGGTSSVTNCVTLKQLYIGEQFRKDGMGRKLIEAGEEYYKEIGLDYVKITALEINKNAINFYKKMGYKRCGFELRSIKYHGKLSKVVFFDKKLK